MGAGEVKHILPFNRSGKVGYFRWNKYKFSCDWKTDCMVECFHGRQVTKDVGVLLWKDKDVKYAKDFYIYLTIRIKIYEQESDMVRKRGKPNSGDTVQDQQQGEDLIAGRLRVCRLSLEMHLVILLESFWYCNYHTELFSVYFFQHPCFVYQYKYRKTADNSKTIHSPLFLYRYIIFRRLFFFFLRDSMIVSLSRVHYRYSLRANKLLSSRQILVLTIKLLTKCYYSKSRNDQWQLACSLALIINMSLS